MWLRRMRLINKLAKKVHKPQGRNHLGKITCRHMGGGIKPKEIIVDFSRVLWNVFGVVRSLEKHKNHSFYIASIFYFCGINSYIIAPENLKPGDLVAAGDFALPSIGSTLLLKDIPFNIKIHNIESFPCSGGKFIRSAGNWAKILEKRDTEVIVLFKNGIKKSFSLHCSATIGRVSNLQHKKANIMFKAGTNRLRGVRPKVRGVVMNPVDHPHGGGKGKKSPKNPNYNFVRRLPKGRKTR